MALNVQLSGGAVRVVPGNARTRQVRRLAAGIGRSGIHMRGRSGEVQPGQGLSLSGILSGVGSAIGGFLTGGPLGAVSSVATSLVGGSGSSSSSCPTGYRRDSSGKCVKEGFAGTVQQLLPFGQTGTLSDSSGQATVGAFGIPAMVPAQVGTITRNDGTVGPILRCPRRMVLGYDNLCYPKAILSKRSKFRKHKGKISPPVTAQDVKAIRRAKATRERVKDLAQDVGWKVSSKGTRSRKK